MRPVHELKLYRHRGIPCNGMRSVHGTLFNSLTGALAAVTASLPKYLPSAREARAELRARGHVHIVLGDLCGDRTVASIKERAVLGPTLQDVPPTLRHTRRSR